MIHSVMNERIPTTLCDTIEKGNYVVVQKVGGEHIRVMRLSSKQKILIEKLKFDAESVFGKPYGLFEVASGQATPVCASQVVQDEGVGDIELRDINGSGSADSSESTVPEEFNVELKPAQALQKLSQEEVLNLKGQGITAGELVSKLVEGSKSFSTRTVYSKSKYIRRKTKKHSDRVLILKPTIRLLAQSYYMKDCVRVSNLRTDQLGMILQLAAVHHGRNVLVFDQVLGLVSAGVIDRLGGHGACIHLHRGLIAQSIPCVHSMNFDEKIFSTFLPLRISSILGTTNQEENGGKEEVMQDANEMAEDSTAIRRADRLAREQRALDLLAGGVDVLIIATRTVDPVSVLDAVFPKLRPSGSVVVFGPHMELILDAHRWLMEHDCVNVRLSDQMFRTHQVLPDRTHPLMAQHVVGGQLLSGIKVIPVDSK
uniref:tRNA (adenine(58)-N(1))-methyltransferase non-catalytic subunit TRM6 n=1 Tax=Haemonchus contortus TaxID=6289 RepID=A0A7I4XVQ0_HAECO